MSASRASFEDWASGSRRPRSGASFDWPLSEELDEDRLEALLFAAPAPPPQGRPVPDWPTIHLELRRPHVTLVLWWAEYREAHPNSLDQLLIVSRRHLESLLAEHVGHLPREQAA